MRRLPFILISLLAQVTLAQEPGPESVQLEVKPTLCVTDNRNPVCNLSFAIYWQSGTTGYYCVFNDFDEDPLRCWTEQREGETTDDRSVQETFTFWMTGEDLIERLAEIDVEVLKLDSEDRRRSRRTRHVWDIN